MQCSSEIYPQVFNYVHVLWGPRQHCLGSLSCRRQTFLLWTYNIVMFVYRMRCISWIHSISAGLHAICCMKSLTHDQSICEILQIFNFNCQRLIGGGVVSSLNIVLVLQTSNDFPHFSCNCCFLFTLQTGNSYQKRSCYSTAAVWILFIVIFTVFAKLWNLHHLTSPKNDWELHLALINS